MTYLLDVIFALAFMALSFLWWRKINDNKRYYQNIPGPSGLPLIGNALDLKSTRKLLPTFSRYFDQYGDIVKVKVGPAKTVLLVVDYKMIEFLLNSWKVLDKTEGYRFLRAWLGTGLLTTDGPKWKKHRKILSPAFHVQLLEKFVEVFEVCGNKLMEKLSEAAPNDSLDIFPFITLCSLDIICESTMGIKINAQEDICSNYVQSVKDMCRIIVERSMSLTQRKDFLYTMSENYRTERRALNILHDKSNGVILEKKKNFHSTKAEIEVNDVGVKKRRAFLDLLLEATVDGRPLSQEEIREEVDTFMFAGHDTTATGVSFALFSLANHLDVQNKVLEEQQTIFGNNTNPTVSYSDLQNMKYLEQVIKETLRLYPSVPIIGRVPREDLMYNNTLLPAGNSIMINIYALHRDQRHFEYPEKFRPDRFTNMDSSKPYSFIPFSAGPRNCIGQKFAMLEMKSIISKIIRNFELLPSSPVHVLDLAAETVLTSCNGIKVGIRKR